MKQYENESKMENEGDRIEFSDSENEDVRHIASSKKTHFLFSEKGFIRLFPGNSVAEKIIVSFNSCWI